MVCWKKTMLNIKLKINLKKHSGRIPVKESYVYSKISLWANSDFVLVSYFLYSEKHNHINAEKNGECIIV